MRSPGTPALIIKISTKVIGDVYQKSLAFLQALQVEEEMRRPRVRTNDRIVEVDIVPKNESTCDSRSYNLSMSP